MQQALTGCFIDLVSGAGAPQDCRVSRCPGVVSTSTIQPEAQRIGRSMCLLSGPWPERIIPSHQPCLSPAVPPARHVNNLTYKEHTTRYYRTLAATLAKHAAARHEVRVWSILRIKGQNGRSGVLLHQRLADMQGARGTVYTLAGRSC